MERNGKSYTTKADQHTKADEQSSWVSDMWKGLLYALLIIASILFFSGAASRFIYVDF